MNLKLQTGFTLAEVLITITVIGIVAAIVMPQMIKNVSERIYSHREANIANKITSAMEVMITTGDYGYFETTEEFVNALKKHLNIVKICDNQHLTECWPTTKVRGGDNKAYNVADVTVGTKLHTKNNTNVVGLILNDGAQLLLTYNPETISENDMSSFIPYKKSLPVGFGKNKEFAYTSSATRGIDYVVDVNGGAGPNSETTEEGAHDIRSFNIAAFSAATFCTGSRIDGMCVKNIGNRYGAVDCTDTSSKDHKYCEHKTSFAFDVVAGARKACDELGMDLADLTTLISIANLYAGKGEIPDTGMFWSKNYHNSTWQFTHYQYVNFENPSTSTHADANTGTSSLGAICIMK